MPEAGPLELGLPVFEIKSFLDVEGLGGLSLHCFCL